MLAEAARVSPTDSATPLHLAAAGEASGPVAAAHLLLAAGASADALSFSGLRGILIPPWPSSPGSRLNTALAGWELDFDLELLAFDQQQKLLDKVSSPRASWGSTGGIGSPRSPPGTEPCKHGAEQAPAGSELCCR